jgi:hypothetical protein
MSDTADFFCSRLDQMIELRHRLAVLASRFPWQELEANIAHLFAKQVRAGKNISDVDLFGGVARVVGSGVSPAGRPRLPLRLMISLLYLKPAFNESDEGVVERWAETLTWQYFSGFDYFEHRLDRRQPQIALAAFNLRQMLRLNWELRAHLGRPHLQPRIFWHGELAKTQLVRHLVADLARSHSQRLSLKSLNVGDPVPHLTAKSQEHRPGPLRAPSF